MKQDAVMQIERLYSELGDSIRLLTESEMESRPVDVSDATQPFLSRMATIRDKLRYRKRGSIAIAKESALAATTELANISMGMQDLLDVIDRATEALMDVDRDSALAIDEAVDILSEIV